MPFNVITLSSTLLAGLFGTIFNFLAKPLREKKREKKRKRKSQSGKKKEYGGGGGGSREQEESPRSWEGMRRAKPQRQCSR